MQLKFASLVAALGLFAKFSFASDDDSDVVVLTKDNFDDFVKGEELSLVEFYAPWCGHCKALAPEYEKAATALKEENLKIAKVDCTVETDVCSTHGVNGYPTLKVFRKGASSDFKGQRTADSIISYLKKQALPALSDLKADEVEKFSGSDKVVIVGYFSDKISKKFKAFESVSNKLRDDFLFGVTHDKVEDVKSPAVVLYKKFDEGKNVFEGKFTEAGLEAFIKANSVPLLDEIGPDNYSKYVESGLPLAYLFVENDEQRKTFGDSLGPVAKETKGKINFVFIDAVKFGGHAKSLNLKETWPAFAIQESKSQLKYPFDQELEMSAENIKKFVDDYLEGKIEPSLKSEKPPKDNSAPVKVVVGTTYEEIVLDTTKDVFLEVYAPWCGHCKKLTPIWDELAEILETDTNADHVVIAKMDGTENDLPANTKWSVQGFPTLKFIKSGSNEVVDYQGDRDLPSLLKFVKKTAKNGDKIKAVPASSPDDEDEEDDGHDEL